MDNNSENKQDFVKPKSFCTANETISKTKVTLKNICKSCVYSDRRSKLKYINVHAINIKNQSNLKMGKGAKCDESDFCANRRISWSCPMA